MVETDFYQEFPKLKNQYTQDPLLKRYLQAVLPQEYLLQSEIELQNLGELAVNEMLGWANEAEQNTPRHVVYDPFGKRIDELVLSQGWKKIEEVAARFGLVATGYERKYAEFSRVHQMALLYIFHPSSSFVSCPLAMTDGAARAIELYGSEILKGGAFKKLTSRDPKIFWTSGQWMTEKTGGSDVGGTQTIAKKNADDGYSLFGTKWFTSATTSQMAMTLARIEGDESGSRGLSLFYLETRDAKSELNKIQIHRLKDKMGTKALPTAELSLCGTQALLVGESGGGVKKISSLFNITRIYNSICSIAQMRRGIELAFGYANLRQAFGKKLIDHPLHLVTLQRLEFTWAGCFHLCMRTAELLGRDECAKSSEQETSLLRALTPLVKLYCGKQVVAVCSEVLECFGGAGYVEDTGLPKLLRDAQTLAIWEGTTNILSLDLLRAFEKESGFDAVDFELNKKIESLKTTDYKNQIEKIWHYWRENFKHSMTADLARAQMFARDYALALSEIYITALVCEFAEKTKNDFDQRVARHWCRLILRWQSQLGNE